MSTDLTTNRLIDSRHQWRSIARDLYISRTFKNGTLISLTDICEHYDLSRSDIKSLIDIPEFKSMLLAEKEKAEQYGDKAEHMFRAEEISARLSESLMNKSLAGNMEAKDELKLLQLMMTSAGIDAPADRKDKSQVNQQVAVQLVIPPGIPYLSEMEAYSTKDGVIDARTTPIQIQADSNRDSLS